MVKERGGIACVKVSNPLTARMVSWLVTNPRLFVLHLMFCSYRVALLVTGYPQFQLHDDTCYSEEATLTNNTKETNTRVHDELDFAAMDIDPAVASVLTRLRDTLHRGGTQATPNNSTISSISDRQDVASLAIHRLLLITPCPVEMDSDSAITSETIRYGASIFMFIVHGPTYYSHLSILKELVCKLKSCLTSMLAAQGSHPTLMLWLVSVGMISSIGTQENEWFIFQASIISLKLGYWKWEDVETSLKRVLWHDGTAGTMFQQAWRPILDSGMSLINP